MNFDEKLAALIFAGAVLFPVLFASCYAGYKTFIDPSGSLHLAPVYFKPVPSTEDYQVQRRLENSRPIEGGLESKLE